MHNIMNKKCSNVKPLERIFVKDFNVTLRSETIKGEQDSNV